MWSLKGTGVDFYETRQRLLITFPEVSRGAVGRASNSKYVSCEVEIYQRFP